jgi:hypothetical protein
MDLALNSTKSMKYLKGYSTKAGSVLIRGVGWKLPTFATDYTNLPVQFYFPRTLTRATCCLPPHASCRHPPRSEPQRRLSSPAAGPPEMSRSPPPPPPPVTSSHRVGLPRPPPLT